MNLSKKAVLVRALLEIVSDPPVHVGPSGILPPSLFALQLHAMLFSQPFIIQEFAFKWLTYGIAHSFPGLTLD